jgi:predicted glycoside hydrolase/deacetylase ChbG (UPF0249 family)
VNGSASPTSLPPPKTAAGNTPISTELVCNAERCPVIVGNTLVYIDGHHMTFEYSRLLAPAIGALAERALADN